MENCTDCGENQISQPGSASVSACRNATSPQIEFRVVTQMNLTSRFDKSTSVLPENFKVAIAAAASSVCSCCNITRENVTIDIVEDAEACNVSTWPDVFVSRKTGKKMVCGECKALVEKFRTKYGATCKNYCESVGRECLGAQEEVDDTCIVEYSIPCDQKEYTNELICECGNRLSNNTARGVVGISVQTVEMGEEIAQRWFKSSDAKAKEIIETQLANSGIQDVQAISGVTDAVVKGYRPCDSGSFRAA